MCVIKDNDLRDQIEELLEDIMDLITPQLAIRILSCIIEAKERPLKEFNFEERYGIAWLFSRACEGCMREGVSWEIARLTKAHNYVISLANYLCERDKQRQNGHFYLCITIH